MDVVIPLREAEHNELLRYSLRSLAQFADLGRVFLLGGTPPAWVDPEQVTHLPLPQAGNSHVNTQTAFLAAAFSPLIPARFVWSNDDFVALAPVADPLPLWHCGPLTELINRYANTPSRYRQVLIDTRAYLQARGVAQPRNFALHLPMPVDKERAAQLLLDAPAPLEFRCIYGNLAGLPTELAHDVKIYGRRNDVLHWATRPWLSFTPQAFAQWAAGAYVRTLFDKPSPFELDRPALAPVLLAERLPARTEVRTPTRRFSWPWLPRSRPDASVGG